MTLRSCRLIGSCAFRAGVLGLLALVAACAPTPERVGFPSEWMASPNFNDRRPSYVVLHHTSDDTADDALRTLTDPLREVSAHYLIARDGRIYQLVDERYRAWHAGQSRWGEDADLNSSSIGIELDNNGDEPYAEPQIEALLELLADLGARWKIPSANVLGHGDIAPGRKVDPGRTFPWRRLAARGFGMWCDPPYEAVPAAVADELLLAALGYDVSRPLAAVAAFKRHYSPAEDTLALTEAERGMLQCLVRKLHDTE